MLYEAASSRYEAFKQQVSAAPQIHLRAQAGQQTLQPSASHFFFFKWSSLCVPMVLVLCILEVRPVSPRDY